MVCHFLQGCGIDIGFYYSVVWNNRLNVTRARYSRVLSPLAN